MPRIVGDNWVNLSWFLKKYDVKTENVVFEKKGRSYKFCGQ